MPPLPAAGDPLWRAYISGYGAGLREGIAVGRRQVEAEEWAVWKAFVNRVRAAGRSTGPLTHAEHSAWVRARQRAAGGDLTPEQIRARAYASWGLPLPAPQNAVRDVA